MENKIKCPSCGHQFEATDAIRDEVQRELNLKAKDWQSKKEEEYKKKEDNPKPSNDDIDGAMAGNLCRCATYMRIRQGIQRAAVIAAGGKEAAQ